MPRSRNQGVEVGMDPFIIIPVTCIMNNFCFPYTQMWLSGFRGLSS